MAEQQTQNTAIVEEKQVPPTDEVEEGPGSKVESPVPPVAKASTPELTESPQLVAEMTVQLMTAKTETLMLCWERSKRFPTLWKV